MDNTPKIDFSPGSQARQLIKTEFNLPKWKLFREWYQSHGGRKYIVVIWVNT